MINLRQFLFIISIFVFSKQQCLEEAALRGLGFTNVKKDPEKSQNIDICGDLFQNVGFCVDPEEIQSKLENTQLQIKGKMNFTGDFGDIFKNLEVSLAQKETEQKKVEQIDQQFQDKQDACFQAIQKVNMGTLCYLASGNAQTNATVDGSQIKLIVNNESTGVELEKCIPMYDALCLFRTGQSITTDTQFKSISSTEQDSDFKKACEHLRQFKDCAADNCKERFKALIEEMKPTDLDILPQEEILTEIKTQFDNFSKDIDKFLNENFGADDLINIDINTDLDDKVNDVINDLKDKDANQVIEDAINDGVDQLINSFRRLQEQTEYKIVMQSSSDGENVVKLGEDSGVPIEEKAYQNILPMFVVTFVVFLIN